MLTIRNWTGEPRQLRFVGYNRDQSACFVRDEQNARRAIRLRLPSFFDLRFFQNPIGKEGSTLLEINRAALHLPACFASKSEMEAYENPQSNQAQAAWTFFHDAWKTVSNHKCWLDPDDDEKLIPLLADAIKSIKEPQKVTLDMVRQGWGGLREKLLEREWVEHFGIALATIPGEAAAFRAWLERNAYNARQNSMDLRTRSVEIGVGLKLDPWQWEVLEALVLFEARFADGSRCWLDAIEERAVTSPEEVEDFEKIESAQKPPEPPPWYSDGFVTIQRCNSRAEVVETLPLSNEFRALCQLLAECPNQTAQYSEIEPQIGKRIHSLDIKAQAAKPSPKSGRRVRDLLKTITGRKLLEWGVLSELEMGREKFLKLSAPKPV